MAEHFLYLTTTGRKTGQPRSIEIWFVAREGRYYMVSEGRERSHWVKNIQHHPTVTFSIGARTDRSAGRALTRATGRLVTAEHDKDLCQQVCALMDAKYGWSEGLIVELTPAETHDHS
jgi:deazaflavin-dependent oxidoreductase (nitroreductase family)